MPEFQYSVEKKQIVFWGKFLIILRNPVMKFIFHSLGESTLYKQLRRLVSTWNVVPLDSEIILIFQIAFIDITKSFLQ